MRGSLEIILSGILLIVLLFTIKYLDQEVINDKDYEKNEKLYPSEEYFMMKQFPESRFHILAYEKAINEVHSFNSRISNRAEGEWVVQGPGNIGARANTIAVDPKNSENMLLGFSEGGLFKTSDGGISWKPVFDNQQRLSIGDIIYDPKNSKVAYAGTGDPNISGFPFIGDGLYKTEDGGETWKNIGLKETRVISQIRVSAQDNNIIYVGAMGLPFEKNNSRGLFKSVSGGSSWQQILFVNDSTGIADFVIHPNNHNIIYAAAWNRIRNNFKSIVGGPDAQIYKSTDGGQSWKILANGLPTDASSRIGIDISISNPNILYASYTATGNFNLKGIYKSIDGGENWQELNTDLNSSIYGGFGWYFGKIRINPKDPDDVFLLAVDLHRSKDGGATWQLAAPNWWTYEVHADKHDLIFSDDNMFLTTDGGAYASDVNTVIWTDIENIATTQFYRVAYNPHKTDYYYGGAQDNGTTGGNEATINVWERIYGGDGFQQIFHPQNPDIFYVETQNGGLNVTTNGGLNFLNAINGIEPTDPRNWDMPIVMSPFNPNVLYTGTNKMYRNSGGENVEWKPISPNLTDPSSAFLRHNISCLHVSTLDSNFIAAGSSDGLLWVSENYGVTWNDISGGLPKKYVSSVSFSPSEKRTLYASYTGYKDNDNTPYIYKSADLGLSWVPIQGTMPDIAINNIMTLKQVTKNTDIIFGATDAGVFYTKNDNDWKRIGSNMPLVTVYDVEYNIAKNQLIAGTFGRSIQTFDLNQINYPENVGTSIASSLNEDIKIMPGLIGEDGLTKVINKNKISAKFNIVDIQGRIVRSFVLNSLDLDLDLSTLNAGIYFICSEAKKIRTISFVKSH